MSIKPCPPHSGSMQIVFLGTGGGRINLLKQIRATGGFRINSRSANIHVDPGPGALLNSIKYKQDPLTLDCVIVTHSHTDHLTDAGVMIEGMTNHTLKKRGVLIGSKHTITGNENGEKGIASWHQSKAGVVYAAEYGGHKEFEVSSGKKFAIECFRMQHDEPSTFGFKLFIDGKVLGYISDTIYIESLCQDFRGCDLLIVNCIKPEADNYDGHLKTADVIEVLKVAKPKKCVITHLGMKMLKVGPTNEAAKIEKATGVPTIAAKDGMTIDA